MVPGGLLFCASLLVAIPTICQGACSINRYCSDCANYTEEGHTKWRFYCYSYGRNYIDPSHFTATNDTVELFQVKYFYTPTIRNGAFRNIPNTVRIEIWDTHGTNLSIESLAFHYGVQNSLQTLLLRSSYLYAVPQAIRYLTVLQELDLGSNRINGDPNNYLSYLTSLQSLWLDSNRLYRSIPASLEHLPNLRKLSLASCYLNRSSVTSFGKLPRSLEWLNLYNNYQLYEVPPGIGLLRNLTYLNMRYCNLNSLPVNVFANLVKLETLDLSQNPNIVSTLNVLVNQKSLKIFRLSHISSSLTHMPNAISGMEKLVELDLSNNGIREVDHYHFAKLLKLRKLYLHQNKIASLDPRSFQNLDHLEELYLGYNLIHEVSPILFSAQSLRNLDLNGNKIDTFDKCTVASLLAHLQKFYISNDLFNCDCRVAWVRKLSAAFGSRVSFSGSCNLPRELYRQSVTSFTLSECSTEDESFESCNTISTTTTPNTKTEHPTEVLNRSFVNSAQISSLQKDLSSVQTITTLSVSVAVVAIVAFVATLAVWLTCFFKRRNRVPSKGRSQGHVNQGLQLSEGVQGESLSEGQTSGDNLYQNTDGMASSAPSGAYEPLRKDGRGLKQHRGHNASSPVVHKI